MESNSTWGVGGCLRGKRKRPVRRYPYDTGTSSGKEEMKEEVVRLGVELSLCVAESMFLLCDDIRTMLSFCHKLLIRDRKNHKLPDPVLERLLSVMHYVSLKHIKPHKRVYRDDGISVQWGLVGSTWKEFTEGFVAMIYLVLLLRRKRDYSFDNRVLSSAITQLKQVLKTIDDKFKPAKDVSEANGFAREAIEPQISHFWKSVFNEEAREATLLTMKEIMCGIRGDLFRPVSGKLYPTVVQAQFHDPYILGYDFHKQQLKDEVVHLGVELSLYVAESMFLLCDDVRTTLWFCYKLWRDAQSLLLDSPVVERLLCVMHNVYSERIKHKNGVFKNDGKSVQWTLITTTWDHFVDVIIGIHRLVLILREEEGWYEDAREFTSRIEEALKKVDDAFRSAKHVSEANGFARDTMESSIFELWNSIFDKEAKKVLKNGMLGELFRPACFVRTTTILATSYYRI